MASRVLVACCSGDDTDLSLETPEVKRFRQLLATGGLNRRTKEDRVSPDLFLPPGNKRTSEPGVLRIYKTDENGRILARQPDGFPASVKDAGSVSLKADEKVRLHEGIDFSSRDSSGKPAPLDFRAGVHGKVIQAGEQSPLGRIVVQVDELKNRVEFLHTSKSYVTVGQAVEPMTVLGKTGDRGAGIVHLHVQARNAKGDALLPDEVISYARQPAFPNKAVPFFQPMKWSVEIPPLADKDFSSIPPSDSARDPAVPKSPPVNAQPREP